MPTCVCGLFKKWYCVLLHFLIMERNFVINCVPLSWDDSVCKLVLIWLCWHELILATFKCKSDELHNKKPLWIYASRKVLKLKGRPEFLHVEISFRSRLIIRGKISWSSKWDGFGIQFQSWTGDFLLISRVCWKQWATSRNVVCACLCLNSLVSRKCSARFWSRNSKV